MCPVGTDDMHPKAAGSIGRETARHLTARCEIDHDVLFVLVNVQGSGTVSAHNQRNHITLIGLDPRRPRCEPLALDPDPIGSGLRLSRRILRNAAKYQVHRRKQAYRHGRYGDRACVPGE
jgi:hypothetical protein